MTQTVDNNFMNNTCVKPIYDTTNQSPVSTSINHMFELACSQLLKEQFQSTFISTHVIYADEKYVDRLIDLELRDVKSSLGLVWSKLSNKSPIFEASLESEKDNNTNMYHSNSNMNLDNNTKTEKSKPVKQPKKKITKKRKKQTSQIRFSHNKFEEIEFKKSNPNGTFIIFK